MSQSSADIAATCISCGRCCFGQTRYVQVFDDDLATLGPELAEQFVVAAEEKDRFMRMEEGHCAALDTSKGLFRCTIYEQRPLICRVYKMYGKDSLCPEPITEPVAPLPKSPEAALET